MTDLRQKHWSHAEEKLLAQNGLEPLTTVYFHKESSKEKITCFKNDDGTFLLICGEQGSKNKPLEEVFSSLEDVVVNCSYDKMHSRMVRRCALKTLQEINDNPSDYSCYNAFLTKEERIEISNRK